MITDYLEPQEEDNDQPEMGEGYLEMTPSALDNPEYFAGTPNKPHKDALAIDNLKKPKSDRPGLKNDHRKPGISPLEANYINDYDKINQNKIKYNGNLSESRV